ncbi:E3 ISG15--protein ligase HERC5 [Gracilariopsis chorda]|uniref:E3 ISG15--protein ligase HERC5 n=1 Tax=Gracilariopsis chorda TaxID=448386 RepID=A0A2V3IP99_9FLOR|nr:E3 ISG15--protein ligase HERC5 [Gracilariopsis chorda]|eukprot:PXF43894.1 E3 ISG15--protein ligase HERC5 [Gracilariopsis chorda]
MCSRLKGVLCLGVASSTYFNLVACEAPSRDGSWTRWLFQEEIPITKKRKEKGNVLTESPGKVLVWGGMFGKLPRTIKGLQENIKKVAIGNGFGGAISSEGLLYGFTSRTGKDSVQQIDIPGKPTHLEVMESNRQLVLLNSKGRVYISSVGDQGGFEPARMMEGILRKVKVDRLSCGREHCVALSDRGQVIAWGNSNEYGQLGKSSKHLNPQTPRVVDIPGNASITDVACGDQHSVFIDLKGGVYSVGCDKWAQLGVSSEPWLKGHERFTNGVQRASLLKGLAGSEVACGSQHSVLLVKDGTVFTFGFNQWGQLGHHNYSSLAPPSPIANYNIRAVSVCAGENHTCLVTEYGELMCIGCNEYGQLGIGTLQSSMKWRKVKAERKVVRPSYIHSSGLATAVVVDKDLYKDK